MFGTSENTNHFKKTLIITIALALMLCLAASFGCSSSKESTRPDGNLVPQTMPQNGSILSGYDGGDSTIRVTAANTNAYVKIKQSGTTVVSFFVRSGSTAEVDVAPGTYSVQFAMGDTWYGESDRFGGDTAYGQDERATVGYMEILSYDLKLSSSGNFSMNRLDPSDF